jgi:hypothetical protein
VNVPQAQPEAANPSHPAEGNADPCGEAIRVAKNVLQPALHVAPSYGQQ